MAHCSYPICLLAMVFLTLKEVSSCCLLSRDRSSEWCRVIPNLVWAGASSNMCLPNRNRWPCRPMTSKTTWALQTSKRPRCTKQERLPNPPELPQLNPQEPRAAPANRECLLIPHKCLKALSPLFSIMTKGPTQQEQLLPTLQSWQGLKPLLWQMHRLQLNLPRCLQRGPEAHSPQNLATLPLRSPTRRGSRKMHWQ